MRIDFNVMMMLICDIISKRSHCFKAKIGSVIVKDGRIISMGYNGMLPGIKNCESIDGCPRKDIESGTHYEVGDCQHAETNAIIFSARSGISVKDADIYVNSSICRMCARNIVSAGIKNVYYTSIKYYNGIDLLKEAGINLIDMRQKMEDYVNEETNLC
jgi:dCMP deaminase